MLATEIRGGETRWVVIQYRRLWQSYFVHVRTFTNNMMAAACWVSDRQDWGSSYPASGCRGPESNNSPDVLRDALIPGTSIIFSQVITIWACLYSTIYNLSTGVAQNQQ